MPHLLLIHPFQEQNQVFHSVIMIQGKTIRRHLDLYPEKRLANQSLIQLRRSPFFEEDWTTLHQATFEGFLNWTPTTLYTDQVEPYALRLATERTRAYRLVCTYGQATFVHPTTFETEPAAYYARRSAENDLAELAEWDLVDQDAEICTDRPVFEVSRDDECAYRIEMVAPSAIYRHPHVFTDREKAQHNLDHLLDRHGDPTTKAVHDPSRLIQALDGESDPWEYDPQARRKSRPFCFFNLGLGQRTWVNGFAAWNLTRFRSTCMLQKGARVRVEATPSAYRQKVQWRVRDFRLVAPAPCQHEYDEAA